MKKREKTANLVNESELLETQNIDLKTQIQDLQKQKRKLMDMLSMHSATCVKQSSPSIRNQAFEDFVGTVESYTNGFDSQQPDFGTDTPEEFQVGSTNGAAMNPYGKDPNFAKLLDDVATSTNYSRSYERPYVPPNTYSDSGVSTNYYQSKCRTNVGNNNKASDNRSCYEYQSDKKSEKDKEMTVRSASKKNASFDEEEAEVFRTNFHCAHDDVDSYKPNGIIDGNFFANRTDVFATGNDYVTAFGNNPLDNGCMA